MSGSGFGEHLKREREMRGVSLPEIAAATRISIHFLEALEQERWESLPGGVFNRGFVRTVARFLGLEEESLLAEYSLATGTNAPPPVPAAIPARPMPPEVRVPWKLVGAAVVVLALGLGGWFGWPWYTERREAYLNAATLLPMPPAPPSAPASLWGDPASMTEATGGAASDLQLKIEAVKDAGLNVTSDGQPTFTGTLSAGQSRILIAKSAFTVEVADAGAVRMELNGKPVDPIAPAGQPGRVTLGRPAPGPESSAGGPN